MTAQAYLTVFCDAEFIGETRTQRCTMRRSTSSQQVSEAREKASAEGWSVGLPGGRDLCPWHAQKEQSWT